MTTLYGVHLFCARLALRFNEKSGKSAKSIENRRTNVERSFVTPQIINLVNGDKSSCPENSKVNNNSKCECNYPLSGPLCSFQCRFDEIHMPGCYGIWNESGSLCMFSDREYIRHCIGVKKLPILNEKIAVEVVNFNHINVKWKLINFPASYSYELSLYNDDGSLGRVVNDAFNFEGLETSYNLRSLCMETLVFGVDCRDKIYENQPCYNCSDISLDPFRDYKIILRIGNN